MTPDSKLNLGLPTMLAYVLPAAVVAGAVGGVFMQRRVGAQFLAVEAYAFGLALAIVVVSLLAMRAYINRSIRNNPQINPAFAIARAWTTSRMANLGAVILVGLSSRYWLPQAETKVGFLIFFLWLVGFYVIMLVGESFWLAKRLRRFGGDSADNADNSSPRK